jgi:hypothetical protein
MKNRYKVHYRMREQTEWWTVACISASSPEDAIDRIRRLGVREEDIVEREPSGYHEQILIETTKVTKEAA